MSVIRISKCYKCSQRYLGFGMSQLLTKNKYTGLAVKGFVHKKYFGRMDNSLPKM